MSENVTIDYCPDPTLYPKGMLTPVGIVIPIVIPGELIKLARTYRFIDWRMVMKRAVEKDYEREQKGER